MNCQTSMSYVEICKWNGKVVFQFLQMSNIPSNFLIPDWVFFLNSSDFSQLDFPFQLSHLKFIWLCLTHSPLLIELFQFDTIRLRTNTNFHIFGILQSHSLFQHSLAHFSIKMCQDLHLIIISHLIDGIIDVIKESYIQSFCAASTHSWWIWVK